MLRLEYCGFDGMANYLDSVDWNGLLMTHLTADSLWNGFKSILQTAIDNFAVVKPARSGCASGSSKRKYPAGIRRALARKDAYGASAKNRLKTLK
jgi:hypothetical protein